VRDYSDRPLDPQVVERVLASVVRHVSDRVGVMYLGEIVELGGADELYEEPLHPCTEALLSVVPELNDTDAPRRERIIIAGDVPDPSGRPTGCSFHPRCPHATERCRVEKPALVAISPSRQVACRYARHIAPWPAVSCAPPDGLSRLPARRS